MNSGAPSFWEVFRIVFAMGSAITACIGIIAFSMPLVDRWEGLLRAIKEYLQKDLYQYKTWKVHKLLASESNGFYIIRGSSLEPYEPTDH